jgi:hypothetical protein
VQNSKINLLKQKKTPSKIYLKTYRDEDLDLAADKEAMASVWVEDVAEEAVEWDFKTVSEEGFNFLSLNIKLIKL